MSGRIVVVDSFRRDGLVFDVRDLGPPGAEAVVCLHGFPQDARSFDRVAPRLQEAGLRLLVPDQRGYSPGARPAGAAAYAVPELVADVLALLDAAGVHSAHVVGHDWGGVVAWALAGRHPERVRSLTALSTPHPGALRAGTVRSTQLLRSQYVSFFQLPTLPEAALLARGGAVLRATLTRSGLPAADADAYVARMAEPGALTAALGWYRALRTSRGVRVARVRVPTTYVWGRRDPFFAATCCRLTPSFVTGPFTDVPLDADHWLPETRPAEVASAVLEQIGRSGR